MVILFRPLAITTIPGATASDLTTLKGTDGADVFAPSVKESDKVVVSGLKGDDQITFENTLTNGSIRGGRDSDTFNFSKSVESTLISGDKGLDVITVSQDVFTSTIDGGESNDTITVVREFKGSTLLGGDAVDSITLSGTVTNSLVNGNADADTIALNGAVNNSSIFGGKGNDVFTATSVTEGYLDGSKGNDDFTVTGLVTSAAIKGGDGADTVELTAAATSSGASILGGEGDDSVDWKGTTGKGAFIDGGAGNDDLESDGDLKDTVVGGLGDDVITIEGGDALIWGGSSEYDAADGKDTITVNGNGKATIFAGGGADTLELKGTGKSVVNGGKGKDKITYSGVADVSAKAGADDDTVVMDDALLTKKDTISGDKGTDVLELTTIGAAIADEDFTGITNFETLNFTGAGADSTVTLDSKFGASGISKIESKLTAGKLTINASKVKANLTLISGDADLDDDFTGGDGNDTLNTGKDGEVNLTGGKGVDQFVVASGKTVDILDFGTNNQADTFNLTSTAAAVNITAKGDLNATSSHTNNAGGTVTITPDGAGVDVNLTNAGGSKGFTIAEAKNPSGANTLIGSKFVDNITASTAGSKITAGKGQDQVTLGAAADTVKMSAGDSTAATATTFADTLANGNTLDIKADTITAGGVKFASGVDKLDLAKPNNLTTLANGSDVTKLTTGNNYQIRGDFAGNVFTVAAAGADTLVFTATGTDISVGNHANTGTSALVIQGVTAIAQADIV